jgi:pimeloyl-ACP methyl ester carboxylesterase
MVASSIDTVVSRDGTRIAFERIGTGMPVIVVDAALCRRGFGPSGDLAALLAPQFAVITYDRRGRGASGDAPPYAVEREIEDLAALVDRVGGTASLVGMSSGAVLALEASNRLSGVRKLAIYEPPLILDSSHPSTEQHWARIDAALAAHDRGAAVDEFLRMVGVPTLFILLMRVMPTWSKLRAMAHTLPYDGTLVQELQRGQPLLPGRWSSMTAQTLVITGSKSAEWMKSGNRQLSHLLPNAQNQLLKRQGHSVASKALAPVLAAFLEAGDGFD